MTTTSKQGAIENARLQTFLHLLQRELAPHIDRVPVDGDPDYAMMACLLDQCAEIAAGHAPVLVSGSAN